MRGNSAQTRGGVSRSSLSSSHSKATWALCLRCSSQTDGLKLSESELGISEKKQTHNLFLYQTVNFHVCRSEFEHKVALIQHNEKQQLLSPWKSEVFLCLFHSSTSSIFKVLTQTNSIAKNKLQLALFLFHLCESCLARCGTITQSKDYKSCITVVVFLKPLHLLHKLIISVVPDASASVCCTKYDTRPQITWANKSHITDWRHILETSFRL